MSFTIGIDVGTTSVKALLFDTDSGKVSRVTSRPTISLHPRPEWTEYSAAGIWGAVESCLQELLLDFSGEVLGVSVASMAEAGFPISKDGEVLCDAIAWHDPRTQPQAERLREELGENEVFGITGQPIQAKFSLMKLLWLREREPSLMQQLAGWLCMEDYVIWKLTGGARGGVHATDFSIASRTLAFDQRSASWSKTMLEWAELPAEIFPTAYQSGTAVGSVHPDVAEKTGLRAGTSVVTGGHDHLCGSLAAGIVAPGTLLDSMGTAEGCILLADRFSPDPRLLSGGYCTYFHVIPDSFVILFGINSAGGTVEWLVRTLVPGMVESPEAGARAFGDLIAEASRVGAGSDGVFWLPHLGGVSSPYTDERSKGTLLGLGLSHTRAHVYRALLEGFSFWLLENLETIASIVPLKGSEDQSGEIVAIGGGTRNGLWMRIKADVLGRPVRVSGVPEATAVGAALLAGVGAGIYPSARKASDSVERTSQLYEPDPKTTAYYRELYESIFRKLYPNLKEINHLIYPHFAG